MSLYEFHRLGSFVIGSLKICKNAQKKAPNFFLSAPNLRQMALKALVLLDVRFPSPAPRYI